MRFVTYASAGGPQLGRVDGDTVVPVPGLSLPELIALGPVGQERAEQAAETALPLAGLRLLAPIGEPRRNILCLGMNYAAHAAESLRAKNQPVVMPTVPVIFTKATTAVTGPTSDLHLDFGLTTQYDWEVELGFVIGKRGKNIPRAQALEYVFGYTVINDVSARDVQNNHGGQFFRGKSFDETCPMGPWIVTADEIADPHALSLRCTVNGVLKQESTTADFIFDIPAMIEWLSRGMTLLPGDVISTGTPSGVGFARTPAEFLKPGDVVVCEVEGVGKIENKIVAA
ncbi:MAG: fumarylacetoacetate hydrolase family protein [Anaerolineales bacterium]|nr:fumarylacetoacetate hydrolase family protein [Anaerolineales bacterium]